ncbi:hypothetical protein AXF42_Ash007376 [Apostasia shenzhenica]|uniref:Uncharacterized protein n=1 Tax=Apostasia shenzhenica TaxID=1088818 RepID=A0A2I0BA36_9ASPA|nr:hypothetical protein AXF42_Ash007376 [Apostasia shenzhenica]
MESVQSKPKKKADFRFTRAEVVPLSLLGCLLSQALYFYVGGNAHFGVLWSRISSSARQQAAAFDVLPLFEAGQVAAALFGNDSVSSEATAGG